MNGESEYMEAIEYGNHLFGAFPNGDGIILTGLVAYQGEYYESYIGTGNWSGYPDWIQEYEETPLKDALEALVTGEEMHTTECVVNNQHYEEQVLESAGLTGWKYEMERKTDFRSAITRGGLNLGVPIVFNSYGDIYAPSGSGEKIRGVYWDWVEDNYEHRHSHHFETKTQRDGVNS